MVIDWQYCYCGACTFFSFPRNDMGHGPWHCAPAVFASVFVSELLAGWVCVDACSGVELSPHYRRVYKLLGADLNAVHGAELPWDKGLGLHMWYSDDPCQSLNDVVVRYCTAVQEYVADRAVFLPS